MIVSNPLNKPFLDEEKLRELEGLLPYEKFISLDRCVDYKDGTRPYINPEDKFVEYEWPQDATLIDYLVRQGDLEITRVVFKKKQSTGVAFDGESFFQLKGRRIEYQEIQL